MDLDDFQLATPRRPVRKALLDNLTGGLRLAFFLDVERSRFHVGADHFIALVALNLALNFAWAFAFVGASGFFNYEALPSALFGALLILFAGYVSGGVLRDDRYALLIPVALASIGTTMTVATNLLWLVMEYGQVDLSGALGEFGFEYIAFGWWALAMLVAVGRITARSPGRAALAVAIFALLVLLPAYYLPAGRLWEDTLDQDAASGESGPWQAAVRESTLYAQPELLKSALAGLLPERPGVEDLYFVGFAPYASEDVFMKETRSVERLLSDRFDVGGRAVSLISHPTLAEQAPLASLTSLRRALRAVGDRINAEEDVLLLHVTSHGSESHELIVEFRPLRLEQVRPAALRAALDDAGIKWRIVVISACFSGGFIDALKEAHTMVVTAADASSTSFGCGSQSDYTYFSRAFFDEALRKTFSFEEAFALAKGTIRARELKEGLEPSNPQIFVGEDMRTKLSSLQARLSNAAAGPGMK